jgi:hypothetical protein
MFNEFAVKDKSLAEIGKELGIDKYPAPLSLLQPNIPSLRVSVHDVPTCVFDVVEVPSPEHVAEIVGKKGGRIIQLRKGTATYIKTPQITEAPRFIISGLPENVDSAKRSILAASHFFTKLRENMPIHKAVMPNSTIVSLEVEDKLVGLVVGNKGQTIIRIQELTNTYVRSPSRIQKTGHSTSKCDATAPIFKIWGTPVNTERARLAIDRHIAMRTANQAKRPKIVAYAVVDSAGNTYETNSYDEAVYYLNRFEMPLPYVSLEQLKSDMEMMDDYRWTMQNRYSYVVAASVTEYLPTATLNESLVDAAFGTDSCESRIWEIAHELSINNLSTTAGSNPAAGLPQWTGQEGRGIAGSA